VTVLFRQDRDHSKTLFCLKTCRRSCLSFKNPVMLSCLKFGPEKSLFCNLSRFRDEKPVYEPVFSRQIAETSSPQVVFKSIFSANLAQQNSASNAVSIFTTRQSARRSKFGCKNVAMILKRRTTSRRRQKIVQCARAASRNLEVATTSFAASVNTSSAGFALAIGKSTEHR
jgi:hypothetical protein